MKITKTELQQIIKEEFEGLSIDEGVWDKMKKAVGLGPKTKVEKMAARNLKFFKKGITDPPVPEQLWDRVALALAKFPMTPGQGPVSLFTMKRARDGKGDMYGPITQGDLDVLAQAYHDAPDFGTALENAKEKRGKESRAAERAKRREEEEEERQRIRSSIKSVRQIECEEQEGYFWSSGKCHKRSKKANYPEPDDDWGARTRRRQPWNENLERLKDIIREELEAIVKK
jgi:hypothetical protein